MIFLGGALEISTDDIPRAKSVIIDNCQFIGYEYNNIVINFLHILH